MRQQSKRTYTAALIGCGNIGSTIEDGLGPGRVPLPYAHAPALRALPEVDFVAAADVDQVRREAFAGRWEVPQVYRDYRQMLETHRPELLIVAGPSALHAEMVIAGAEAGVRGILCEKPIATNLRDADRMIAACKEHATQLIVNHSRRFDPFYRRARQLVTDGEIGEPVSVVATWRGNMLFAGTHLFDLVNFYLSDADVEFLVGDLDAGANGTIDPGGSAYLRYKGGAHAFMNADTRNAVPLQVDVIGIEGKIVIGNYNLELWKRHRESSFGELVCHPFPAWLAMEGVGVAAVRDLIHCVETGEASISNGHIARTALGCCLAVHDSARQGNCLITFPYTNLDLDVACR